MNDYKSQHRCTAPLQLLRRNGCVGRVCRNRVLPDGISAGQRGTALRAGQTMGTLLDGRRTGEENEPGQIPEYPARFYSDPELLEKALSLQTSTRIYSGLICSGDQFITTRKELDKIKATFPNGLAVDMESASIAHVCYMNKIPFLSFRIISDTPGIEDHTTQYNRFWEEAPQKSFEIIKQLIDIL